MSNSTDEAIEDVDEEAWRKLHEKPLDELNDSEITSKLNLSLKRRFSDTWVLMFEFAGQNGRQADAIAVNTVASRNYKIVGFEVKASRSDWLSELKDPEKADHFVRLCDEWYVVAPKGVVQESEIPAGWGYLEMKPNSEQLYKMQDSELTEYQQGEPGRAFWIRFLKKTVGSDSNYTREDLKEARSRGYEEAKEELQERANPDLEVARLRDKAESWDALRDRFDPLPFSKLSDEKLRTIELGIKLVRLANGERLGGLHDDVERLQGSIERRTEEMMDSTETLSEGIEKLQERVERGQTPDDIRGGDDGE